MSTFFWILGILATAGLTFPIAFAIAEDKLRSKWAGQWKKLEKERQEFKLGYDEAQQWYSRALQGSNEKYKELTTKEKQLQELKEQMEVRIAKNDQEKEECIANFRKHYNQNEAYVIKLESQLANARQRSKRFAKQSKKTV